MATPKEVPEHLDSTQWYWHIERDHTGMFVPALRCYRHYVTVSGIWFDTERDCLDWINAAAKAQVRGDVVVDEDMK